MTQKSLEQLGHDSCILAAMIEGLDALHHAADGHGDCPLAKRARNALPPMIDATIAKAWALNEAIEMLERAEMASRKK